MFGRGPRRSTQTGNRRPAAAASPKLAVALAALLSAGLLPAPPARADGLFDSLLEKLNVKAAPPGPGPDFVERTRPDPAGLGYLPTATPHKVSPVAVKTPAEIQARKDALDVAQKRQLDPNAGKPVEVVKAAPAPAAKARPAAKPAAVSD